MDGPMAFWKRPNASFRIQLCGRIQLEEVAPIFVAAGFFLRAPDCASHHWNLVLQEDGTRPVFFFFFFWPGRVLTDGETKTRNADGTKNKKLQILKHAFRLSHTFFLTNLDFLDRKGRHRAPYRKWFWDRICKNSGLPLRTCPPEAFPLLFRLRLIFQNTRSFEDTDCQKSEFQGTI